MQQSVPDDAANEIEFLASPRKDLRQLRGKLSLRGRQLLEN